MAEELTKEKITVEDAIEEKEIVPPVVVDEVVEIGIVKNKAEEWKPKTSLGKMVKAEEIKNIDEILGKGMRILEPQIVDYLLPNLDSTLLLVGQSKGKFGGGKRTIWRQTQKKTKEGNKPKFATICIVGNKNGYLGMGFGKSKETVPAREKALRDAKLNIVKIRRGCGSWECGCGEPHSIPLTVKGKVGSVEITLIPAPKGTGLICEKECKKILQLTGIKDVYSKARRQTRTKLNLAYACLDALKKLTSVKIKPELAGNTDIIEEVVK
ncbi:MAG: 30S ribosomal protein S5 [Candidatus Woesearchaeota archaeon]|nr:MAG: 30S ribosomal protein S5 [Candidatus Woesearchaeota archaeon]